MKVFVYPLKKRDETFEKSNVLHLAKGEFFDWIMIENSTMMNFRFPQNFRDPLMFESKMIQMLIS